MPNGLTSAEAGNRLKTYGYNELISAKSKNIWHIVLEVMREPMFMLLISCGLLYMFLGNYREGGTLLSTILIIIYITFYQYRKTEKALEALRKLSSPRALVIRDGKEMRIPGREVVPGDLVKINEGDRIAADARILQTGNLTIDESLLTGESMPVLKSADTAIKTKNQVFSGTLVVQGSGLVEVTATGVHTEFGKIGSMLHGIERKTTRLQKEMKVLIRNLFIISAFICIGVIVAFYLTRGNFLHSLLNGLATAMAILPEEFPVVLTIFMALGAWRLSKKKVLTRDPTAIETLGSATVLCSDKTGTITQNRMDVAALFISENVINRDEFDLHQTNLNQLLQSARFASSPDTVDPMEKAINEIASRFDSTENPTITFIREYPLSKDFFAMTRVVKNSVGQSIAYTKGAPEAVLSCCQISDDEKGRYHSAVKQMAERGLRVLAVGNTAVDENSLPENQREFKLNFEGLIGFEDPIRPEVPQAIKECKEAGIKVIMITGDYPETARSIGLQIGLDPGKKLLTGDELNELTDAELAGKIEEVNIIARVVPEQKLRIVQAFKANNEIVAMTGDGVNDAPALKAANIGIAMGNKGTDVAREASSLVLLDDNFASIVGAIRSGRKIFDNLQKAMSYIIAIHIPIIGLALLPAFVSSIPLLLMPLHIVFMELIIDPVCSVAFESEQEEKGLMQRPPRKPEEKFFGSRKILLSSLDGLFLFGMVVGIYFLSIHEGHSDGEVRAIAFSSLIIGNLFLILSLLSRTRNFIAVFKERNMPVIIIMSAALILLFLVLTIPPLQKLFSFEFPGYRHFGTALLGSGSVLMVLELTKRLKKYVRGY